MRWLLLPEEERQFRQLKTGREAVLFIEFFWRRRDPTPTDPGNPFLEVFHDRVQAADRLYGEEQTRGSLTDRGRVLILLGPPPVLRHRTEISEKSAPVLPGIELPAAPRQTVFELWEYPPDHLPPQLLELLDEEQRAAGITLAFSERGQRTRLIEGEELLDLAARALANQPLRLPDPEG